MKQLTSTERSKLSTSKRWHDNSHRIRLFLDDRLFPDHTIPWVLDLDCDCVDLPLFKRALVCFRRTMVGKYGIKALYVIENGSDGGGTLHLHGLVRFPKSAIRGFKDKVDFHKHQLRDSSNLSTSDVMRLETMREWMAVCKSHNMGCKQEDHPCLTKPKDFGGEKIREYMLKLRKGSIGVKEHEYCLHKINLSKDRRDPASKGLFSSRRGLPSRKLSVGKLLKACPIG